MGRFLRIVGVLALLGGLALAVVRTDNPVSAILQSREARRLGFVETRGGDARVDLWAFRTARDRCKMAARVKVQMGADGCRLCMVKDCLETEGARFKALHGMRGHAAPPGSG